MMRDFDKIMIPLQLNLTSQGCIDKDVRPSCFKTSQCPLRTRLLGECGNHSSAALSNPTQHRHLLESLYRTLIAWCTSQE